MPTVLQFRRGTTAQNNSFTGAAGELSVDTDLDIIRVHDGSQPGGFALVGTASSQSLTNKSYEGSTLSVTGNVTGGNLITAGLISATGNITGNFFLGNGSQLTGIDATSIQNGTSSVAVINENGNIRTNVAGTTIATVSSSGLLVTGSIEATNGFIGLDATAIANGTANVRTFANANVTVSAAGIANVLVVTGTGGNIAGTLNATGNANVGNLGATTVVATNLTGTLSTAAQPNITSVGTLTALTVTGNISGGNVSGTNLTGTLLTAAQPNITSVGTLSSLSVTGNVTGGNLITAGTVQTSNLIVSGIESVGTLNVSGDTLISGNLTVSGTTFTANVQSLVVTDPVLGLGSGPNGTPLVSNDGLDRGIKMFYYTTAEQIAFMGYDNSEGKMLSAANVSIANNVITVNSLGTTVVGTLESAVVTATGNITGGNLRTASVTIGNGPISGVTTISASGNANVGNIGATNAVFTNVTGTVTTATQPNITSVGTLTSLSVTGNISGGNVSGTNLTGTLLTAAQTNITSVGTLTSLAVTGNTTSGNFVGTLNGSGANVTSINATNISSGTLAQARLANASLTVNGTAIALGGSATITAVNPSTLTIGTGLGGTSYNGSAAVTITNTGVTSAVAGTGVSVSAATGAVTITNTGVTSAVAGTGVSVSAGTGAVTFSIGQAVGTGNSPTFAGITLPSITKNGSNGVGNIGQSNNTFNTVFARATSALYADLAELYTADANYVPGTVLIFGGSAEVTESIDSHCTQIAGVVSTNPAHVMNSSLTAEHTAVVALVGRVPCRVVGTIRRGDCLVSSDIPGVATTLDAARYQPGAIIGKALETYNSAEPGVIEVVVGRL